MTNDLTLYNEEVTGITLGILNDFLESNTTKDHIVLFIRAADFFRNISIDSEVEDEYEALLLTQDSDESDKSSILDELQNITLTYLDKYLNQIGIKLSDDISFERKLTIIESIYLLEFYEDSESLCRILESDEDNEVQLSMCLSEVNGSPMEEFLVDIWYTPASFLLKIHELHKTNNDYNEEPIDIEKNRFFKDRLKKYSQFIKTTNTRVINLIRLGMPFGLPIETYIFRMQDILQQLPTNNVAVELYSLYLISKEYEENPMTILEPYIELIGMDIDKTSQIRQTLINVIKRDPLNK